MKCPYNLNKVQTRKHSWNIKLWCLSYLQTKPQDPGYFNKKRKQLFNDYYIKEKGIRNYNVVEYVEYDKEYTDANLDNENMIKEWWNLFNWKKINININVYIHDKPE